jgi:hypothetical protein
MLRVGGMRGIFMSGARKAGARTGRLSWVRNKGVNMCLTIIESTVTYNSSVAEHSPGHPASA